MIGTRALAAICAGSALSLAATALAQPTSPLPDAAPGAAPAAERIAVTIFEFRSSLPNVSGRAATDMFKTALVRNGRFQVVKRGRLNEGVLREKQLNAGGYTTGDIAQHQLRGARYVFEGIVSEANTAEKQRSASIAIAGISFGGASITDSIAIDVRIIDAANGDVVDAVVVRKPIQSKETALGIVGAALPGVRSQGERHSQLAPDAQLASRTTESVDRAMRAAIEEAVETIAGRFAR